MLSLTLFLVACEDVVITEPPVPAPVALESGIYEIQVLSVASLSCDGVRARDLIGESTRAAFRIEGQEASVSMDGWELEGEALGSRIFVEGELSWDEPSEPPQRDDDVDYGDDSGDDSGDDKGDDSGAEAAEEDCEIEPEEREEGEEEDPESMPEPRDAWAAMDLSVVSARLANGTLDVVVPECSMTLEVAALFVSPADGRDDGVVVMEETEEEEGPVDE